MARRAFKSDVSFLEKISMGAIGTRRVFADAQAQGHDPIELERGSTSFKIWKKIKIKRIRVPDILCVACARRVESRAKTDMAISMSHSFADPERGWDHGLRDDDVVALVGCRKIGEGPVDWQADELVQYVSVKDLRAAHAAEKVDLVKPKGAEEGFEARITWPAVASSYAAMVIEVTSERVQLRRLPDSRLLSRRLLKNGSHVAPLVKAGDTIKENQFLAAVVPVSASFPCSRSATLEHYLERLSSTALSERYGAVKALRRFSGARVAKALLARVTQAEEHIFVRLEAAAGLSRQGREEGWAFIACCLEDAYLQHRLEAVITLAEIAAPRSVEMLCAVLADDDQDTEIRAGAAWGLGELGDRAGLEALVATFASVEESIRIEAARALAKLASKYTPELLETFRAVTPEERPGLAWALSRGGRFHAEDLLRCLVDEDARQWTAYALGMQDPQRFVGEIEALRERDPEVFFAVTVLWKIVSSWVYALEEHG